MAIFRHYFIFLLLNPTTNLYFFSLVICFELHIFFMVNISCIIPIPSKNIPNNFLSNSLLILLAKILPNTLAIMPVIIMGIPILKSTNLFLQWIISDTIAVGKKAIKFNPWAICCLNWKNMVKIGINSVPPPMPIPAIIPLSILATISRTIKIITSLLLL